MATPSTQSKCAVNDKVGHLFFVDKEDKRFKICQWCGKVVYRSDEELLEGKM